MIDSLSSSLRVPRRGVPLSALPFLGALGVLIPMALSAQAPPPAVQIAAALLAAPEEARDDATVIGWTADGRNETLRRGSNDLVCLADNPAQDGWSVACYHESLEPYMARGRDLAREGVTEGQERLRMRWAEAEAGTLAMPEEPATLYVLAGQGYDAATNTVERSFLRWVLYTPWATLEDTGLTAEPTAPGAPWLMGPGTAGAHVMITPPPPTGG